MAQQRQKQQQQLQQQLAQTQQRNNLLRMFMLNNPNANIERPTSPFVNPFRPQWPSVNQQPIFNLNNQQQDFFTNRFPSYQSISTNEANDVSSIGNTNNIRNENPNGIQYKIVHLKLKMEPQNGSKEFFIILYLVHQMIVH